MTKRPVPFIAVAAAAWAACAAQAIFGMPEGLILCPFRLATGHRCPGCGMGHAVVYAMRGDFAASFSAHPLGIPLFLVWTGWLIARGIAIMRGPLRDGEMVSQQTLNLPF